MKFQRIFNILVVLVLCLLVFNGRPAEVVPMAISQNTAGQKIDFGNLAATGNLTAFSFGMWIYPTSYDVAGGGEYPVIASQYAVSGENGWALLIADDGTYSKTLVVNAGYSGTNGAWVTNANAIPSLNAWYYVEIQFDTTGDPRILVNGVSQTITETSTPTGTYNTAASYPLILGNINGASNTFAGTYTSPRIWNRIRTVAQSLVTYDARTMGDDLNGVVFAPVLYGAAGLQAYDGVALGTSNTLVDPYSGAVGVPTGSPVGSAETYLSVCP